MPRAKREARAKSHGGHEKSRDIRRGFLQARQDSNLQPPVLETGALPN